MTLAALELAFRSASVALLLVLAVSLFADFRNVLLSHKPARFRRKPLERQSTPDAFYADATWSESEIELMLAGLTLGSDAPLSCLIVETLPGGSSIADPLGAGLGQERLLRTSPLVPVPAVCAV